MHGEALGSYAYGMWPVVVFNVALFLFFVGSFLNPKKRYEWRSMGAFIAFLVALFTEMYGFPLTIYLMTGWLGTSYPALNPFSHASGHLVLVGLGLEESASAMVLLHVVSNGVIFFGLYVVYLGWKLIHGAPEGTLVTEGVYARIRHPQYSGLFLVTIGFLIQWPSLSMLVMWPILTFAYYRLARREERALETDGGEAYREYRRRVPGFIPRRGVVAPRPAESSGAPS